MSEQINITTTTKLENKVLSDLGINFKSEELYKCKKGNRKFIIYMRVFWLFNTAVFKCFFYF